MDSNSNKSLINLYLQKVSRGEAGYIERLVDQLSERLIFVPVIERQEPKAGRTGSIKIEVFCIKESTRSLVPVFTTERLLRDWCSASGSSAESIKLLGADLCGALAPGTWVLVNPGSDTSVELQPALVEKMKTASPAPRVREQVKQHAPESKPQQAPAYHEERLETKIKVNGEEPQPAEAVPAGSIASSAIFTAPDQKEAETPEAPKKRKRSFLGFFKSA